MEYTPSFFDNLHSDIQPSYKDSLMHYGVKGMHWGVRRYQNSDGTLTSLGKQRYSLNPFVRSKQKKEEARQKRAERKRNLAKEYAKDPILSKHIKWDDDGNIVRISKQLEKAVGTSLENIDDDELLIMTAWEAFDN